MEDGKSDGRVFFTFSVTMIGRTGFEPEILAILRNGNE